MPEGHCHFICTYTPLEMGFTACIKLQLATREEAEAWLEDIQQSSRVTLRVDKTYPITEDTVRRNSYRVDMKCQHNTRQTGSSKKNTHCPAVLYLVLKKHRHSQNRKSRSSDTHIQEGLLLHVTIKHHHNHRLGCSEALQHRDVSRETVEKLEKLFQSGHSPSSALNTLKYDLQEEQSDSYLYASADRSICPDVQFCYRLYYSIFKRDYGASSGDAMLENLQERLEVYNKEQCETCGRMESTADGQTVIALCTPVMKRIHRLERHSGEMLFMDSSGGLPLGVIVTTSESQNTIAAGLKLLQSILPGDAFYGRGVLGPKVVMTDDCKALRQALQNVFPQTTSLLCVFHVLQAMWRWLWDSHHGVPKGDRQWLLDIFKKMVYAMSPEELEASYHQALQDPAVLKHQQYRDHLTAVFAQRKDWAICLRTGLPTRGNDTNNFVESAMRVLKDSIFHRLKAYNITQLVDFICTRLEAYYIRRLLDVANGRTVKRKFKLNRQLFSPDRIFKQDESNYTVPSEQGGVYLVNISMGMCTCPAGTNGALCKHQHSVMQAFKLQGGHHLPVTSFTAKKSFYEMATEKLVVPDSWFMGLQFEMEKDCPTVPLIASTQGPQEIGPQAGTSTPTQGTQAGTPQDGSGTEVSSQREHLKGRLRSMFNDLVDKLQNDETFQAPIQSLVSSYESILTDSGLISALSTFGKMRSAAARNIRMQARKGLQMSTQIGVQPTAVARRKTPLGGRRALITGRPPKRARREHNYGKVKEGSGALPRRLAPHSLAQCVSTSVSLGSQHSKK
ncbi:uncharacterized protein LOC131538589 isoform X2 [Onychostoma macrolepis]|uniref:uncharacterized protein LOC131538589 isoform X2 n=1 Tax=Onychostoma macrolepis TaxID=369639 RepID=UPI00272BBBEF|nr:uncharacterized protein LOC131538589 isoform X2 [Onychostoma macrolepis]